MFGPLITNRLVIRRAELRDLDALVARRNEAELAEYQSWASPYAVEGGRALLTAVAEDSEPPVDSWWQLSVEHDGDVIGDLALRLHWGGRAAEVGYTFVRSAWGKGFATEALHRLLTWLFDDARVNRVEANLHPDNLRSARVVERCGFDFEGHTRNSYWVGDVCSDGWIYGLTPERWARWNNRSRTRPDVLEFIEPDPKRLRALHGLRLHKTQERFVSPMMVSLAQAGFPPTYRDEPEVAWPRMIVADDELVGFVMLAEPSAALPDASLWRLSIDRDHQGRGIGMATVLMAIEQARTWGAPGIEVSYVPGVGSPEPLYRRCGFEPTGELYDDLEIVARIGF